MFSFHKPRVYRSTEGCCICRAKSSSSRFTDSKKYEIDSVKCFNLDKPRQGEICNACVLLVKRFKRLPIGSNRHWGHVVDARIGPGMKSISKFKKLKEECQGRIPTRQNSVDKVIGNKISSVSEKFCKIFRKNKKKLLDVKEFNKKREDNSSDDNLSPDTPESLNSDEEEICRSQKRKLSGINRRKGTKPMKLSKRRLEDAGFFDEKDWKPRWLCCGVVYENSKIGALIIDYENIKPCCEHNGIFKLTFIKSTPNSVKYNNIDQADDTGISIACPNNLPTICNEPSMHIFKENVPGQTESIITSAKVITNRSYFNLKKHSVHYKRQLNSFQNSECTLSAETNINDGLKIKSSIFHQTAQNISAHTAPKFKNSFLQKVKSEKNKLMKNSLEKVLMASKVKALELTAAKELKTNLPSASMITPDSLPTAGETSATTKFSDNSSDSGFDENLPDHCSAHDGKERKIIIRPIESLFLSSTIPVTLPAPPGSQNPTVQSFKTIHTPHSIAILNNRKIRAIYNATSDGGLTCVKLPSSLNIASTTSALINTESPARETTNAHTKFLYVKGNQNIDITDN